MKAVVIRSYGGPEVLELADVPRPRPGKHEVLVRVAATSVNPVDWLVRDGGAKSFVKIRFPAILGCDLAGEVVEVGAEVKRLAVGDAVFAMMPDDFGAHAEYVALAESLVVKKPASLGMIEAAALPVAAMTALAGLRRGREVQAGERVLINGASGGVGLAAVQIAKALGGVVTAVCSRASFPLVERAGAAALVDYNETDFRAGKQRFDRVFDTIGNAPHGSCADVLTGPKIHVTTTPGVGTFVRSFLNPLCGVQVHGLVTKGNGDDLAFIAKLVDRGQLAPVIDRIVPFEQVAAAQEYSKSRRAKGKIVLELSA